MSVAEPTAELERTLRERFALERFRPGQREVIESVLGRRDVLCVMPTGGGKSLCYQLPALLLEGVTLVVSPLIALMKDQVDALTQRGIRATLINSTLDPAEQRARLIEIEARKYDLVYVAPERFRSGRFIEAMSRVRPALLAVDEAHCISEWGHDFRPDYARLGHARRALGMPPCIALTATATDLVRRDVADQLDLREPAQFVTGFDRPNLSYRVVKANRDADKLVELAGVLERNPGPAIVYASARKRCEAVGHFLEHELRRSVVVYHAGLGREERTAAQDRFMSGDAEIVVATNAFGMGVDKPDIRSVTHFNMPGTVEAYYQEAGRAGRDGLPAECVLLFAVADRKLQEFFIESEYPPPDVVYRVYEYLRAQDADPIELTQAEIREVLGIEQSEGAVGAALKILEGAGGLERFRPRENMAIVRINAEPDETPLVERLGPQAHVQRLVMTAVEGFVGRRLGEPVYFHPDEFAAQLGLERTALTRALRTLASELPIDYIPPFRGNAVRILDRNRRSRDLTVDFASLNQRKGQEYDKLERMIRYAQAAQCRRAYILGYFGDSGSAKCGQCDNCGPTRSSAASPMTESATDTPAGREVVLKALSGVARAKGRFGKTTVAQMLTGSASEKMDRWRLRELSTFGILSDFKQAEVVQLLDALIEAGLLENQDVDRFRPVLNVTDAGRAYLRGKEEGPLALALPEDLTIKIRFGGLKRLPTRADLARRTAATPRPADADEWDPADDPTAGEDAAESSGAGDPLSDRLRKLRTDWAREAKVPHYCVFSDETLGLLVRHRPTSPRGLADIKGLGPSRIERYGAAILDAIRQAVAPPAEPEPPAVEPPRVEPPRVEPPVVAPVASRPVTPPPPIPKPPAPAPAPAPSSAYVPTEEWTWRLLDRGFNANEAAAIRGLEPSAILRHATWMARQGKPVPIGAFVGPEVLDRWDSWRREHGDASPPPEPGVDPAAWALFLACHGRP